MNKLNIGCGPKPLAGWINIDCRAMPGVDVVCDLNSFPWQFSDNSADEILASHVIEHLDDPLAAIMEMRRILKPGGKMTIKVPHVLGPFAMTIGHYHYFGSAWFRCLEGHDGMQNDPGTGLFSEASLRMNLFPVGLNFTFIPQLLIATWERFFNRSPIRQILWETLGMLHPGEIVWVATKKGE
jgi:SAM-dependent methyltransferase